MITKIQIKSIFGSLLFECESENNSVKNAVLEAIENGANLRDADLSGADLRGANLRGADLRGANLRGANLRDADLSGANLRDADLSGAYLSGANISGAYLSGANISGANLCGANLSGANGEKIKIKKAIVFTGLYKYLVIPFISEAGEKYIKMGCYMRLLSEWETDFWNNNAEFPNDNSEKSNLRLFAFETAKKWFEVIDER